VTEQGPQFHEPQTTVVTEDRPLDPSGIMRLATAYWESATLLAANDLGVFAALADGARTAPEVADQLGLEAPALVRLLDACCGLNLIVKQGDNYMLPSISAAFLVPGTPGYLGNGLRWARDQYDAWGHLADSVRSGAPALDPGAHLGGSADETRTFVLAMHDRAQGVARGVIRFLNLEGCETLLDVGGGPGTYSMLLAQHYPELHATVLDLPGVVAVADELIARHGLQDRVSTSAGDASFGDYGEDRYDSVLFSGVLHQMPAQSIRSMLAAAHRALKAGGRLLICDIMADATKTQPVFAALFSLQMLLSSKEGAVFATESCMAWLEEAGFRGIHVNRLPPPLPYTVLSARK
jgi:ubiquinone/menaquinone biosynthesis C-methylase UbiE